MLNENEYSELSHTTNCINALCEQKPMMVINTQCGTGKYRFKKVGYKDGGLLLEFILIHDSNFKDIKGAEILNVSGPHPAGNVGVHVSETEPMNMGDRVWTVGPEDVAIIGRLFLTGKFDAKRTIAVVGADAKDRKYFRTYIGADATDLVGGFNENESRVISGDMLTGIKLTKEHHYLGYKQP